MKYLTSIVMNVTYKSKDMSFFLFELWFGKIKDHSHNTADFFCVLQEEKFLKFQTPQIQNLNVVLNTTYIETEIKK